MSAESGHMKNLLIIFYLLLVSSVNASSDLCIAAAKKAAEHTGVPEHVLIALALTETGRASDGHFAPWPWTLNIAGSGRYLASRAEAMQLAVRAINDGHVSTDLGCFQINYRWHGDQFSSLERMLDPDENALYAAKYLLALKAEFGQWYPAIGAYHSRNDTFSERYMEKFSAIWADLETAPPPAPPSREIRPAIASLFPLTAGSK